MSDDAPTPDDAPLACPEMSDDEYEALPPLVPEGENREDVIERVVEEWCISFGKTDPKDHARAGGFVLRKVALVDGNTNEPIDLGELTSRVAERLAENADAPTSGQTRHILLVGCLIPKCDLSRQTIPCTLMIRRGVLGDRAVFSRVVIEGIADFAGTRFGDGARFTSVTFGDSAHFDSAKFGFFARFDSAKFGFFARFDWATFGEGAGFTWATFSAGARFTSARFGEWASFDSARFGIGTCFDWATFGGNARFDWATFGVWASFNSTRFGPGLSMVATGFEPPGGIEGAVVALRPDEDAKTLKERVLQWLGRKVRWCDWNRVRSVGELHVLTKVTYTALLVVPLVAGGWQRIRVFLEHGPEPWTRPLLPISWALGYLAALCVALGHFLYQVGAPEEVKRSSRDGFRERRNREFREASEHEQRDLIERAFPLLSAVAERLPHDRHPNLVKRHGKAVWVPRDWESLNRHEKDAPHPSDGGEEGQAVPEGPHESKAPTTADDTNRETARPRRAPKYSRRQLELVLIDEGAAAEYDLKAHEELHWALRSVLLYAAGGFFVAWLIFLQLKVVLESAGWPWFLVLVALLVFASLLVAGWLVPRWRQRRAESRETGASL